jgi:hypothetical protein
MLQCLLPLILICFHCLLSIVPNTVMLNLNLFCHVPLPNPFSLAKSYPILLTLHSPSSLSSPIPCIHSVIDPRPIRAPLPFLTASRQSKHLFTRIIRRVDLKTAILVYIYASIIFDFKNVDLQHFWIGVVGWDEVVECNSIIINHT